jgi:hypothetical protein
VTIWFDFIGLVTGERTSAAEEILTNFEQQCKVMLLRVEFLVIIRTLITPASYAICCH